MTQTVSSPPLASCESSLARRVVSNTAVQFADKVVSLVLGLVMLRYLSRYLGVEGFGKYGIVQTFVPMFGVLTDWGINTIAVREMSKARDRASVLMGNFLVMKMALALLAASACWLSAPFMRYSADTTLAIYVFSFILLLSPVDGLAAIFQTDLRNDLLVFGNITCVVLNFALLLGVIAWQGTLAHLVGVAVVVALVRSLLLCLLSRKLIRPVFRLDFHLWKEFFQESLPMGVAFLFSGLYASVDVLLLSKFSGESAVGTYNAALRLIGMLSFVPLALATSVFPLMSVYAQSDRERLKRLYQRSLDSMIVLALPLAVGTTLLAPQICRWLYGVSFASAALPLQILIWRLALAYVGIMSGYLLVALNRQHVNAVVTLVGLVVSIGLNLLLVPRYSYLGTAIAALVSFTCIFALPFVCAAYYLRFQFSPRVLVKCLIACMLMATVLHYANALPLTGLIGIGALIYAGSAMLTGAVSGTELRALLRPQN